MIRTFAMVAIVAATGHASQRASSWLDTDRRVAVWPERPSYRVH
jgi:hypothetical protein